MCNINNSTARYKQNREMLHVHHNDSHNTYYGINIREIELEETRLYIIIIMTRLKTETASGTQDEQYEGTQVKDRGVGRELRI